MSHDTVTCKAMQSRAESHADASAENSLPLGESERKRMREVCVWGRGRVCVEWGERGYEERGGGRTAGSEH